MSLRDFRLSVLGNNITYMNFAVQTLQWLLEVIIIKKIWVRHHQVHIRLFENLLWQ